MSARIAHYREETSSQSSAANPDACRLTRPAASGDEFCDRHGLEKRSGFTLVEIMIVVVIIGLLAAMALPSLNKVRTRSQATAIANDIRTFRDAIESYALENGVFPEVGSKGFPTVFRGWIGEAKWNEGSALAGGVWQYYAPGGGYIPELVLDTPGEDNAAVFSIVDEILDDGDGSTGLVTFQGAYILYQFQQ